MKYGNNVSCLSYIAKVLQAAEPRLMGIHVVWNAIKISLDIAYSIIIKQLVTMECA